MRTPKPPGRWPTYRNVAEIVASGRKIIADRGGLGLRNEAALTIAPAKAKGAKGSARR
jgi:hypothetical protein